MKTIVIFLPCWMFAPNAVRNKIVFTHFVNNTRHSVKIKNGCLFKQPFQNLICHFFMQALQSFPSRR